MTAPLPSASPVRFFPAAALLFFSFLFLPFLPAQEPSAQLLDADFDTLFDEIPPGSADAMPDIPDPAGPETRPPGLRNRGFALDFSYRADGGFSPGLSEAPWFARQHDTAYSHVFGVKLNAYLGLDVRLSETFRAKSTFSFSVPENGPGIDEFFLDYSLLERIFFRAGKFGLNWGISPNFPVANLLSRVPEGNPGGDSLILKADIPSGIGGFEFLALTRRGFMAGKDTPGFRDLGYGVKYNLAISGADLDFAVFYHDEMPLRVSLAFKTAVRSTELYLETMGAVRHGEWDGWSISGNAGFVREFFGKILRLNGEVFWNGEENAAWFKPESGADKEDTVPFIRGLNGAVNFTVRPGWFWNLRFVFRGLWALEHNSFHVTPGITANPLPHLDISLGFPMALGSRGGRYYRRNGDYENRPWSVVLLVTLGGNYRYARYE